MTMEEARQIIATWLVSSKGEKGQRGYIEGWFDVEDAEAFRMAIEALKKQAASEWIPVEQDLPDSDRPVLVTIQWTDFDREVTVGEYWGNPTKAAPESEKGWGTYGDHVTAWREMPEPWRGENDD